ncbi:MAG: HAMP domain-containing protein [Lutibacter sp.]|uniref:HAMP domain-containing sensor histidine kinase n=1 Tax=Lutibacter sp. TaxID=1925666 RepID=UPI00385F5F1D
MRRFSITDKLIIASFLLSVVIIIIVASYSFFNAKIAILDRAFSQMNSVRVIKTNLIENFFYNCKKDVQLATSSSDIQGIIREINVLNNSSEFNIIDNNSYNFNNSFVNEILKEYYNNIYIIGYNKLVYPVKANGVDNINYNLLWKNTIASNSVYLNDFSQTDSLSQFHITLSSKITDSQNNPIGIIVFEILPSAIDSIMLNNDPSNGLGISGESYLVGDDYLMRSSSRFQTNSILNTYVETEAVDSAFVNLPGTKVIKDYRGVKVLSSYNKINIPDLNWAIFVEIDYKEVTVPIYKIRNEIIFISIFIFLIVLIVIIVLSKKITYPIQKLNQAAHEVGLGNFEVEIHYNSNDEIGELSDTFNQMIEKLKTQAKELEIEKSKSLRSLIDGQETERQRLSRELHDSLGQLLIGLKLKYESCLNQLIHKTDSFADLSILFDQTIEETRRISNNLMPATLSEFGLTSSVRNICNEISETTDIHIQYNVEGSRKNLNLEVKIYLFRIIQEGLTNIIKHSKAKNASILLLFEEDIISISIEDDGCGFDQSKTKFVKSNGLNNIKDRVALLSGKLVIISAILKGTKINIEVPINTESDECDKNYIG